MRKNVTHVALGLSVLLFVSLHASAESWSHWRGPNGDAISSEKGLLQSWPADGPKLVRTISGFGLGHSSPMVTKDRILVTGYKSPDLVIQCYSFDGKLQWSVNNGRTKSAKYGAMGSAIVDGDTVYAVSRGGTVAALEIGSGSQKWKRSSREFKGRAPFYKYAETVLISNEKLIWQPGGKKASVVALNKNTGETIWKSAGLSDTAAYCSAIVREIHGVRQIILVTEIGLVGLDEKTGKLLWRYDPPFKKARNSLTPVVWNDHVFAESGHKGASAIVKVYKESAKFSVKPVWELKKKLKSHLGGHVVVDGKVYGHDGMLWICRDILTGKELYSAKQIRNCSTTWADGRFYCFSTSGTMYLVEANGTACKIVSQFKTPNAGAKTWARPSISNGRLYLRQANSIHVYDIKAR